MKEIVLLCAAILVNNTGSKDYRKRDNAERFLMYLSENYDITKVLKSGQNRGDTEMSARCGRVYEYYCRNVGEVPTFQQLGIGYENPIFKKYVKDATGLDPDEVFLYDIDIQYAVKLYYYDRLKSGENKIEIIKEIKAGLSQPRINFLWFLPMPN